MNLRQKLLAAGFSGSLVIAGVSISEHEGFLTKPYLDPKKILTVCWGHTGGIDKNRLYSTDDCVKLFKEDLLEADEVLKNNIPSTVYDKLTDKQKAAFISFIFNVGPGGKGVKDGFVYLSSGNLSTMIKNLKKGDITNACLEFPKWNKDRLPGIIIRRKKEMDLCLNK